MRFCELLYCKKMFSVRLRNAAPFLSAGIAAGSAVLLGYHACYGTGNDTNYVFAFTAYFCFASMNVFCSKHS